MTFDGNSEDVRDGTTYHRLGYVETDAEKEYGVQDSFRDLPLKKELGKKQDCIDGEVKL